MFFNNYKICYPIITLCALCFFTGEYNIKIIINIMQVAISIMNEGILRQQSWTFLTFKYILYISYMCLLMYMYAFILYDGGNKSIKLLKVTWDLRGISALTKISSQQF
jgi:hypothetical protein